MTKLKIFRKIVIFVLIFAMLWCGFENIFEYKWDTTVEHLALRYEDYEKEPENSIDVLFIGSSPSYEAYVPTEIYNESGITSINFGTSNNRGPLEYYNLLYALKHQNPKVVFLDFVGYTDHEYVDYSYRDFITCVPDWDIKLQTVKATKELYPDTDILSYFFPLLHYHSRWEGLTEDDFNKNTENRIYETFRKGNYMVTYVEGHDWSEVGLVDDPEKTVGEDHVKYCQKIVDECKSRDIQVVVAIPPRFITTVNEYNTAKAFAAKNDLTFWDFSTVESWQEIGVDPSNNYIDSEHFNIIGARIYSNYVARRLQSEFPELPDHRGEAGFESWDENYDAYVAKYEELLPSVQ